MEGHKMDYLLFSVMRMCKRHLFCTSSHHNVPYEKQQELNKGSELEMSPLLERVHNWTHLSLPHGEFFFGGTPLRSAINWFVAKRVGDIMSHLKQLWRFKVYMNMYSLYYFKFNLFYFIS